MGTKKLKLYKLVPAPKQYWETWEDEQGRCVVHWGELGETGLTRFVRRSLLQSRAQKLHREIQEVRAGGVQEVPIDDHSTLLIEFQVNGMGTKSDVEKRHRLQDRMDETLGWSGLGHCDGSSIGSGTMEVCCLVVDFELAKSVIQADLENTEFADYTRIYDENGSP